MLADKGACGHSKVVAPLGNVLSEASEEKEEVLLCDVDLEEIGRVREKIPSLKEYDSSLSPIKK